MTTKKRTVLATVNARYSHSSLALRYLLASLGPNGDDACLLEFTLHERPEDMLERVLEVSPALVALSVTIWNLGPLTELASMLKTLRPNVALVVGGPEVWFEHEDLEICRLADHVVTGEADLLFPELVDDILSGHPPPKRLTALPPDLSRVALPYALYSAHDLETRLTYVETSRGCPFRCTFCLSSLDDRMRYFPLDPVLAALSDLIQRGARSLKFVDRSINVHAGRFQKILETCLAHYREGLELHFEVVPAPLRPSIVHLLEQFPPGAVQLEVGVQTLTPQVATRVARSFDMGRVVQFFDEIRTTSGLHIHSDLIFGLPAETLDSFASSFDALLGLDPDEIQVGILKRLRGTPIATGSDRDVLRFNPNPPYDVLETDTVSYEDMNRVKRFARYFDLYYNSGNFERSLARVLRNTDGSSGLEHPPRAPSAFFRFLDFSDWLYARTGQTHRFALARLYQHLFDYLVGMRGQDPQEVGRLLLEDYDRHTVRRQRLEFLKPVLGDVTPLPASPGAKVRRRQSRKWKRDR